MHDVSKLWKAAKAAKGAKNTRPRRRKFKVVSRE
jgi:hypothetical protein